MVGQRVRRFTIRPLAKRAAILYFQIKLGGIWKCALPHQQRSCSSKEMLNKWGKTRAKPTEGELGLKHGRNRDQHGFAVDESMRITKSEQ